MNDDQLADEAGRIAALHRLEVLDTGPELQFDKIVALVCTVLGVPTAAVTLVDQDRQWFKARRGLAETQTSRAESFCAHTIRQREPLVIEDASTDPRFADNSFVTGPWNIRAYAGVPLTTADGYNVGALCAIDTVPRTFTETELDLLARFGHLVIDELELREIANSDYLTGALSRRGLVTALAAEIARSRRYDRPAALALLDIDHFKQINDQWGHPAGDIVLRELAARCMATLRPSDMIGRIGGEEFALLLPETTLAEAHAVAERIRLAIESVGFENGSAEPIAVTVSLGIAPFTSETPTPNAWLAAADAPLYAAKRDGRNRCVLANAGDRQAA